MISLIIRVYNNAPFIQKAVESALHQTHSDYEIVVINDGSTDGTAQILDSFDNPRLRVFHQENKGAFQAAYDGLEKSRGDLITFLDGDDFLEPTYLAELHKGLLEDSSAAFSYCDYWEVNLNTGARKLVSLKNIFNSLVCGLLYKRVVLEELGFWDKEQDLPEYDLLIRVLKKYPGFHVPQPLFTYNRHPGSMTADKEFVERAKQKLFDKYGEIPGFKEY